MWGGGGGGGTDVVMMRGGWVQNEKREGRGRECTERKEMEGVHNKGMKEGGREGGGGCRMKGDGGLQKGRRKGGVVV